MTKCAIYTRISEDPRQQEKGVKRQLEDCEALAASRGWEIVGRYTDNDLSAFREGVTRPAYQKMMRDAERGAFSKIICYSTSRVWRRRSERALAIEQLGKLGIGIVPLMGLELDLSTSQGRSMAAMLGEADTVESDHKKERVARAALERAQEGRANGSVLYGWRREYTIGSNGKVKEFADVEDVAQASVVREIVDRLLQGDTLFKIALNLNKRRVPTPASAAYYLPGGSGILWKHTTLSKLALRPANIGQRVYHREVIGTAQWPPIVDPDKHARVVALLNRPARRTARDASRKWLLSFGIGQCGSCGSRLSVKYIPDHSGVRYPIYCCAGETDTRKSCVARNQAKVDEVVAQRVVLVLKNLDLPSLLASESTDLEAAREKVAGLRARLEVAADAFSEGGITGDQLKRITARLRPELNAAEAEMQRVMPVAIPSAALELGGPDAEQVWHGLDVLAKRAVMQALKIHVVIQPRAKSGAGFDPDEIWVGPELSTIDLFMSRLDYPLTAEQRKDELDRLGQMLRA